MSIRSVGRRHPQPAQVLFQSQKLVTAILQGVTTLYVRQICDDGGSDCVLTTLVPTTHPLGHTPRLLTKTPLTIVILTVNAIIRRNNIIYTGNTTAS